VAVPIEGDASDGRAGGEAGMAEEHADAGGCFACPTSHKQDGLSVDDNGGRDAGPP
jgi:hypothetical protein